MPQQMVPADDAACFKITLGRPWEAYVRAGGATTFYTRSTTNPQ